MKGGAEKPLVFIIHLDMVLKIRDAVFSGIERVTIYEIRDL